MRAENWKVLVVDDDEIDTESLRRLFRSHKLEHLMREARDGVEALAMMRGDKEQPALERPYVVLLDINMPRMSGLEFLKQIRQDPELSSTLVYVLTTSDAESDIQHAFESDVAGYFLKGREQEDLSEILDLLRSGGHSK